jgi:enediyne polyketide synthase
MPAQGRRDLTVDKVHEDGWAVLSAGDVAIATCAAVVRGRAEPLVFAVLAPKEES